jgi:hypothetical protein
MQLTTRLLALLAVTAAAGFGAAFLVARSGADDGGSSAPARGTLPSFAATGADQTIRGAGAAAALPDLRRRPRTKTPTVTTATQPPITRTTQPPITTTTQPPITTTTQPPITTQASPTTTQSAPPVTTQSG